MPAAHLFTSHSLVIPRCTNLRKFSSPNLAINTSTCLPSHNGPFKLQISSNQQQHRQKMILWLVFLALFVLCAAISAVFMVYIGMLWYATVSEAAATASSGRTKDVGKGMSASELEMLPSAAADTAAAVGKECAVCLEDIETGQPARVLPLCRHAFHRPCADAWLSTNAICPLCRAPPIPLPPPPDEPVV